MSFEPRSIINGKLLREFIGKNVSILINIEDADSSRRNLKGKSTDNIDIKISSSDALSQTGWTEIIGIPEGPNSIRAKEAIFFESNPDDEAFDSESHNLLVNFLRHGSHSF